MQQIIKLGNEEWERIINDTHSIFSVAIKKLLIDSYLEGSLTKVEVDTAKAYLKLKPELDTSKILLEIISKMETEALTKERGINKKD